MDQRAVDERLEVVDEEYWPPPPHPMRLAAALVALLGCTGVVLLWFAGTAGFAGGTGGDGHDRVEVPELVGGTVDAGRAALGEVGLGVEVVSVRNVDVPAGEVFRQVPEAGTLTDEGTIVELTVSAGDDFSLVPQLHGSREDDLAAMLVWYGLEVGEVTYREDLNSLAGEVLDQVPPPGVEVPFGTAIDLVVSEGPPPVEVPDVTGMSQDEAIQILTRAGFRAEPVGTNSTVRVGRVVSTDPRRGDDAPYGSTVRVFVSRGPRPVTPTTVPEGTDPDPPPTTPTSTPSTTTPSTTPTTMPDEPDPDPDPDD